MKMPVSRTKLASGVSLSIQASQSHYCLPRTDDCSLYMAYEVGYIENEDGSTHIPPKSFKKYADLGFPSDVYSYVPVELILRFIKANGGVLPND